MEDLPRGERGSIDLCFVNVCELVNADINIGAGQGSEKIKEAETASKRIGELWCKKFLVSGTSFRGLL